MTKSFLFPETNSERALPAPNENGLRRCFSPGSFAVFEWCGFAAPFSCGGFAPPVGGAAARPVRAISSILRHVENCKVELAAAQGAAARAYCVFGLNSNWRFRREWFAPMFFRNAVIPLKSLWESRFAALFNDSTNSRA